MRCWSASVDPIARSSRPAVSASSCVVLAGTMCRADSLTASGDSGGRPLRTTSRDSCSPVVSRLRATRVGGGTGAQRR